MVRILRFSSCFLLLRNIEINLYFPVNRVKEGTGVIINISENDGSNVIRIEGNVAGVMKAKTVSVCVCIFF